MTDLWGDFMTIDLNNRLPLHIRIKEILKQEIQNKEYTQQIPSERELVERFGVSRSTIRSAISALVQEGILQKKQGVGTFITYRPVRDWLGQLRSFTETINSLGMIPGSKLLYNGIEHASATISSILGVEKIYVIERLRFADNMPVAIEKHYYPIEIGEQLIKYDLDKAVIYNLLEMSLGIILWEAEQSMSCVRPTKKEIELLNIDDNTGVLISERVLYDSEKRPIEFLRTCYHPDLYSFNIKLFRGKNMES